jgi:hypothetical protein
MRRTLQVIDAGGSFVFPGTSNEFGLGNIQYMAYFSPAKPGKVIWGLGPVLAAVSVAWFVLGSSR